MLFGALVRAPAAVALAGVVAALGGSAYGGDGLPMRLDAACREAICPGDRSPVWSPDGRTIAFVRYVRAAGGGRRQAIYEVDADGGGVRRLDGGGGPAGFSIPFEPSRTSESLHTCHGLPPRCLVWSPDATKLAVAVRRASGASIWVLPRGGTPRLVSPRMTFPPHLDGAPSWSPDGRRLAFERHGVQLGADWCCQIWVVNADGSGPLALGGPPPADSYTSPVWSPDGRLAYITARRDADGRAAESSEIRIARADGSGSRLLARGGALARLRLLGWSGDGRRLFFVSFRGGIATEATLEAVDSEGRERRVLLDFDLRREQCCWVAPDGSRAVIMRAGADGGDEVRVLAIDGTSDRKVADGLSVQARSGRWLTTPSWSPDGSTIAYLSDGECPTLLAVHTVSADGTNRRRLTRPCRRVGTPRADKLHGGPSPDALYGRQGNDRLDGGRGADLLQGGAGRDLVHGDRGDDRVYGGRGRDRLYGDDGWDALYARGGAADVVRCGAGRDAVRADEKDAVARDCELVERE